MALFRFSNIAIGRCTVLELGQLLFVVLFAYVAASVSLFEQSCDVNGAKQ